MELRLRSARRFSLFSSLSSSSLLLLLLLDHFLPAQTQASSNTSYHVPALIAFGDSIVDPGNNNDIGTIVKCNFPPYGKDFLGNNPTGRFCNGRIPTDFIASVLGIKQYVPAYVGVTLSDADLLTGVSFASGGAGYDQMTSKFASVISMSEQLDLFKDYKEKLNAIAGEERANSIIANSVYIVCAGSDDIANNYFALPFRRAEYDMPSYADLMVQSASRFLEGLLDLGARKIGVVSAPPVGCVPSQRTLAGGLPRDCSSPRNDLALLFNSGLSKELQRLGSTRPSGTLLVYIDIYYQLLDMITDPSKYGFDVSTKGCCGTGLLEVSVLCNGLTSATCPDASKYVFWDSYHPTERAYQIIIDGLAKKYLPLLSA